MDPLVFKPYLRPVVWGGRRLGSLLGKPLMSDAAFGESWELSPHPHHVSRVAEGPHAGLSLDDLCRNFAPDLFGPEAQPGTPFPLLIKFLDCRELLSIQVHPNDQLARQLAGERYGKSEAWVVLHAEPGATIYAGFKAGIERADVDRHLAAGTLEQTLHALTPRPGDCLFLPAGTVHAVGGGVLMAEVQQASDATFRLYDWNRVGTDGRPRELHIEQALESIDWSAGPVQPVVPRPLASTTGTQRELCVDCAQFRLELVRLAPQASCSASTGLSVWLILEGHAELSTATGYTRRFQRGETVLIPTSACDPGWNTGAEPALLLKVRVPQFT